MAASSVVAQLEALKKEYDEKRKAALTPLRERLNEIARLRAELNQEEAALRSELGEAATEPKTRTRRSSGRRVTATHKKEAIANFIRDGHIKNGQDLSSSLRAALRDAGFGVNDFRVLNNYLPSGWTSKSNGLRGTASKTTFHHG